MQAFTHETGSWWLTSGVAPMLVDLAASRRSSPVSSKRFPRTEDYIADRYCDETERRLLNDICNGQRPVSVEIDQSRGLTGAPALIKIETGIERPTMAKLVTAAMVAAALSIGSLDAQAHCDSVDGPVAKAAENALESGNINPVLAYAPASAEAEIRAAFEKSGKVRALGPDAQSLADQAFMETVIRLHRAGEGAPYTGLKPAGIDYGPAIPAADRAVETGDLTQLKTILSEEIEHALRERLEHVRELQKAPREPKTPAEVPAARERVSAELGFVTFAESLRQAALGRGTEHHE